METNNKWEIRFKFCGALSAIVSAFGVIAGFTVGLVTYHRQVEEANAVAQKELRLATYAQKKDVQYELADAAAAVASATTDEEAKQKAVGFRTQYLGRAHVVVIDSDVSAAKVAFRELMEEALSEPGSFPCAELEEAALDLTSACRKALRVEEIFAPKTSKSPPRF